MDSLNVNSFCLGGLYGFFAAGGFAIIANQIRQARTQKGLRDRTLDNFPASAQPNLTSTSIFQNSWRASMRYGFLIIIQIVYFGLTIYGLFLIFQ
jgi:hypothetical protein